MCPCATSLLPVLWRRIFAAVTSLSHFTKLASARTLWGQTLHFSFKFSILAVAYGVPLLGSFICLGTMFLLSEICTGWCDKEDSIEDCMYTFRRRGSQANLWLQHYKKMHTDPEQLCHSKDFDILVYWHTTCYVCRPLKASALEIEHMMRGVHYDGQELPPSLNWISYWQQLNCLVVLPSLWLLQSVSEAHIVHACMCICLAPKGILQFVLLQSKTHSQLLEGTRGSKKKDPTPLVVVDI